MPLLLDLCGHDDKLSTDRLHGVGMPNASLIMSQTHEVLKQREDFRKDVLEKFKAKIITDEDCKTLLGQIPTCDDVANRSKSPHASSDLTNAESHNTYYSRTKV